MKANRNKNNTNPNPGWNLRDQTYLDRNDNAQADPAIQFFTEEKLEEELEQRTYYCSFCKSKLDHLQQGIDNTIWRCNACMACYDTSIQDLPLKNISGQLIRTYPEFEYYQVYDENDINAVFVQGIDPEERSLPKDLEMVRDDNRVKHIRVKGSPVEAMAAMNNLDNI